MGRGEAYDSGGAVAGLLAWGYVVSLGPRVRGLHLDRRDRGRVLGRASFVVGAVAAAGIFLYVRVYGEDEPTRP